MNKVLRRKLDTKIARYIAFCIAICSVFILTTFKINEYQSFGWMLGVISCSMWAYWGWQDRSQEGYGRFLMEITYVLLSIWGIYNWYG
jgi:hypothetical protein